MELLKDVNSEQKKAITHGEGPLLIVAGAGTGKTTVIAQRLAWLIDQKLAKPDEILALTFTEKAATELEERVDRLLPYGYLDLWVHTFHGFGERILKAHALDIGIPNEFKVLSATDQWLLVRQALERFNLAYYRPLGNPTKFIHALLAHFSRAKDELVTPEQYAEFVASLGKPKRAGKSKRPATKKIINEEYEPEEIARLKEVAAAFATYQQLLYENGALDFGDLMLQAHRLFTSRVHILKRYQVQFKYILVDEFQDTNWAQYELVKLLGGKRANLTFVGDDDQSIYKFRGASVSNILSFRRDYPKADNIVLTRNYRSYQEILDAAYTFILQNNPNRLEAQRTNSGTKLNKKLIAERGKGARMKLLEAESAQDEAALVVKTIIADMESSPKSQQRIWSDYAILVRSNDAADVCTRALERAGVPYEFMASRGLYLTSVIIDIVSWLKLLDNYHESRALWRVLATPSWQIPESVVMEFAHAANKAGTSLYKAFTDGSVSVRDDATRTRIETLNALIITESERARKALPNDLILTYLEASGYLHHLKREAEAGRARNLEYLEQFMREVALFQQEYPDPSLKHFLERFEYVLASGDEGGLRTTDTGPEAVKVMTVHASKGLEFHTVFVVGLVDKRFPTIARADAIELPRELIKETLPEGDVHLQEERRLFYVAMTRARDQLFFTRAFDYGGVQRKKPSRFLMELGLASREDEKAQKASLTAVHARAQTRAQKYELPSTLSFTQLKAFETCPLQYKYAHIFKIPVRGKGTFSFGKTMHAAAQHFYELAKTRAQEKRLKGSVDIHALVTLKELLDIYEHVWIDEWYANEAERERYRKQGAEQLVGFYQELKGSQPIPKYLEKDFRLKVGAWSLKGRIDRADEVSPGKLEIVDYKTGKSKSDKKLTSDDKEQLLIYQLAVARVFPDEAVLLSFWYFEDNAKVSFIGTGAEITKLEEKITEEIADMQRSDFQATPGPWCAYCDFRNICEFRAT